LGNVLDKWGFNRSLYSGKYDLIANLPYYIATNIILKALEDINCEQIIVMVQKEVANKFVASAGDKNFSSLGVITKLLTKEAKIVATVLPQSFNPPPKVKSAVIRLTRNNVEKLDCDEKLLLK
jgi:16S rRNA (adenine1518-N6/adenine1519-N6)-dimethyltransferase